MKTQKILVVEDDPAVRELLMVNLSARGFYVSEAEDGEDAVFKIFMLKPDLVLLDIGLPRANGWEIINFLKNDQRLSHTKVIFLTGNNTAKDKMIGVNIFHADDYITKPFDINDVSERIEKVLQ